MKCRIVSSDGVTQNIHDLYDGRNFKCIEILRSSKNGDKITFTLKDIPRRIVRLDILHNCIGIFKSCNDIHYVKLKYNRKTGFRIKWIVAQHVSFGYILECIPIGLCYLTNIVAEEEVGTVYLPTIKWTSSDYTMIDKNLDDDIEKYASLYGTHPPTNYTLLIE
jgi:hypothetical protein